MGFGGGALTPALSRRERGRDVEADGGGWG